jgi:hypothetical protein
VTWTPRPDHLRALAAIGDGGGTGIIGFDTWNDPRLFVGETAIAVLPGDALLLTVWGYLRASGEGHLSITPAGDAAVTAWRTPATEGITDMRLKCRETGNEVPIVGGRVVAADGKPYIIVGSTADDNPAITAPLFKAHPVGEAILMTAHELDCEIVES